jgi:cytochrome c biogenesis protein CcmG, thiol:disulfide interchange protein DsbE
MTRRREWAIVAMAVALLGGGLWLGVRLARGRLTQVSVGSPAPDFRAAALDGSGKAKGIADYRGQVVLINLWATWCGPCVVEMPSIQRLYDRYRDAGLQVVGIAVDDPGFEDRIREFVNEHKLTFEILHDGSGSIERAYQAMGLPATFIVGRDGKIRKLHLGAANWDSPANRAVIAQLLGVANGNVTHARTVAPGTGSREPGTGLPGTNPGQR